MVAGALVLTFLTLCSLASRTAAQLPNGPIQMKIVGAEQVSPIAVSGLKNLAGDDDGKISKVFDATLDRDLKLSGYFHVIDPKAYIENSQTSGYDIGQFNFGDWSSINAEFLVKGAIKHNGNDVSLEVLLFDVGQQRRMMGRKYSGAQNEVGEMADRFADALLESVTGTRGPFASKLAFVSTRGGRFKEIFTSWLDGHGLFQVTNNPTINLFPSFDKSATHLLYLSYKTMSPALYLADLGARTEVRIQPNLGMAVGGTLAPSGSIAGAFSHGGPTNLFLLDSAGNEIRALTNNHAINVTPSFCADGEQLVFASDRSGTPQIYAMSSNGGGARRLTYQGDYNTAPAFSPDCKKVAYESRNGGVFQIFVIDASGGAPRQLTNEGSNESPTWSPDGRYLAFASRRGGGSHIYMMLAADGKITGALTQGEGNDSNPSWSGWLGG
jgi:TolB protein